MARRELQEINAGSMADIAFLLLIFWLVTTTIDSDEGIKRQLPPPVPDDIEQPDVKQRNVFVALVNLNDALLVENNPMDIRDVKAAAKDFLIASGDGLMSHPVGRKTVGPNRDVSTIYDASGKNLLFPERVWVRRAEVELKVAEYQQYVKAAPDDKKRDAFTKILERWQDKLTTLELLGGDYKELPPSAVISLQTDRNTTYNTYMQVQNELTAAVNELRNELSMEKFGATYTALEEAYDKNKDDLETLAKINAVRAVYPQRISEADVERNE
jgi:biopolymer transport protein ExbD